MRANVWTDPGYEAVTRLLSSRTGLSFPPNRRADAEAGIVRVMAKAGIPNIGAYLDLLRSERIALDDLIAELTVGETYFFREPNHFAFLRREVLPEIRRRRGLDHAVRIWSAGCSTGEEAYSLAILLEQERIDVRVLATDLSRASIARAEKGGFRGWSMRGVDEETVGRYFRRDGNVFTIDGRFRERVAFDYLNLALDDYPSFSTGTWGMDLIFCRNVLIYFDRATVRRVAERLFDSLSPGGWLIAGPSDPPLNEYSPFAPILTPFGVFYRRDLAGSAPAAPFPDRRPAPVPSEPESPGSEPHAGPERAELDRVLTPTPPPRPEVETATLRVRALADAGDLDGALGEARKALDHHSLVPELHYLHAILMIAFGREAEAVRALRQVLYLDSSLAFAHATLGSLFLRTRDLAGARRAFRNALDLASRLPAGARVALSDDEVAGRLTERLRGQLSLLEKTEGRGA